MKRYGRSPRLCTTILLPLLACFLLTACQPSNVQPTVPTPPQVNCNEHAPAALIPDVPDTFDKLQVWVGQVIGIYRGEVIKRATTAKCLDALRTAGAIR